MSPDGGAAFPFDGEAAGFDRRAGLPAAAAQRVAAAVLALAAGARTGSEGRPGAADLLLDLGAGTGEIGEHLVAAAAPGALGYLGVDLSLPMLLRFRHKLAGRRLAHAGLLVADADRPWPVADGRARVIFSSRAVHLLDLEHVVAEILRLAGEEGAVVILGRVRRERDSVRSEMRRRMRRLLARHGVEGRSGEEARERLLAALEECGGQRLPPRQAAAWRVSERPAGSLAAWRSKPGLAGRALPPELRDAVLGELEGWARRRWGDLEAAHEATERYELSAVLLRGA